jgi:L-threonylcarbamoyladenylate synthase
VVRSKGPGPGALERAATVVARGGVIAIPTDTVYGIGARPSDPVATSRLFAMKSRPESSSLPVLVADTESALRIIDPGSKDTFSRLAGAFWPGPLTIVLPRRGSVSFALGGGDTTIGVRCPGHELTHALLERTGPLAVTSANRSGAPPATTSDEVRAIFGPELFILDGGVCDAPPSTVLSLVEGELRILREGSVTLEAVRSVIAEA